MSVTANDWLHLFPMQSPRQEQIDAINHVLTEIVTSGKRYAVLDLAPGVGKSAVGLTIARFLETQNFPSLDEQKADYTPGAYFLTTQKILQEQYVNDFGQTMRSLKSSSNYSCNFYPKQSCEESHKALKVEPKGSKFSNACNFNCTYRKAKEDFLAARESITNFSYFMTEAAYSGKITPRKTLVVDEAHNICDELSRFVEVLVSEHFCTKTLKLDFFAGKEGAQNSAVKWIRETYYPQLVLHLAHIEDMLKKFLGQNSEKLQEILGFNRQIELLRSHKSKLETFLAIYSEDNWVFNILPSDGRTMRKLEFKPIDVSPFAQRYLFSFGRIVVMMSATILGKETFCESLGLPLDQVSFISIPSPFPIENRPLYFTPVGKMNKDNIDTTLPNLAKAVKAIIDEHKDEKGVIHCHTFAIAKYLKMHIRSKRLLIHDSTDREEILRKHMTSTEPTVLLSPSMTEGVDLKGDASRFQILCKVPYPYLGDKLCKKRMKKWTWWYPKQTVKTIVQALGRSVRSMDDHAVSYILDEDWEVFYNRNAAMFPADIHLTLKKL